jgi:4-carboxymuconolactone decarboxylase
MRDEVTPRSSCVQFTRRELRIPPVLESEWTPRQRRALASVARPGHPLANVYSTLVRDEELFEAWAPFCQRLLYGRLSARWRELVILRVAYRCDSFYEWVKHSVLSAEAGVSVEERDRVAAEIDDGWDPAEAVLLRAVDEMHDSNGWSDSTWNELGANLDEKELVELAMLIGQYHLVAFALNSFGVQLEGLKEDGRD